MTQPKPPFVQRRPGRRSASLPLATTLACLLLASQGCGRPSGVEESTPPFSFRALNLEQRTSAGLPAWSLTSPQARYDLRSSVARALRPQGVIFEKGAPLYKLAATTGTVINDGVVILLEGDIRLQRLGKNPLLIRADRALWIPRDSLMRFELNPNVRNQQQRLSAQSATLLLEKDLLQLRGDPTLESWSKPVALSGPPPASSPEILGKVKEVDWHPGTGQLTGQGPVSFARRPPGGNAGRPPQLLKASRLSGNTLKQEYTLSPPVLLEDSQERSWFRGGELMFNTKESWLKSAAPFQAQKGDLQVQGDSLRLDGKESSAHIERNCRLQQGQDGLEAQRCQWNWKTQAIEAAGQVIYRRQANGQLTRAERIEGHLGPNGSVKATAPGGRVFSQLRVPRRSGPLKPQRPRPKPQPIVF